MFSFLIVPAQAQNQFQLNVSHIPLSQLSFADIDFENATGRNLFFTITVTNNTEVQTSARLKGSTEVFLNDGTIFSNPVSFLTKPIVFNTGTRTITNLDIGRDKTVQTDEFSIDDRFKDHIKERLGANQLAAGRYIFRLVLVDENRSAVSNEVEIRFEIQSISRIELRSPQNGEITGEFPLFEFIHEANEATIRVAEKLPGQSPEEAITREPLMLKKTITGNSFLYSGGRPLEDGKRYVWQISVNQFTVGGGVSQLTSPIWEFTVSSTAQRNLEILILNLLEEILGQEYSAMLQQLREQGATLTGRNTYNGSLISTPELLNLLRHLSQNVEIVEVILE